MTNVDRLDLSIVVPVFNEETSIDLFIATLTPILERVSPRWEILFVNDGSRDATLDIVRAASRDDPRVRCLDLSRNFGKEVALTAGLDHASGRAVVPMDVDLQDPPELIVEMVAAWRAGYDVVLARRDDRSSDGWLKRHSAAAFYRLIARLSRVDIPANVGDFRLLDAKVVEALRAYPERERFMKGIFASVGFRTTSIGYVRSERARGTSKFRPHQLLGLALEGIVSFSSVPLKIWTYVGGLAALGGIVYAAIIVARTLILGSDVPGYASLLTAMLVLNGLTLIGLGIQGEYIARIFSEVKRRPLYVVREAIGTSSSGLDRQGEDRGAG